MVIGTWAALAGGCAPAWRPSLVNVEPAPTPIVIHLGDYQSTGGSPAIYLRQSLTSPDTPPQRYKRCPSSSTLTEGLLAGKNVDTVSQYLESTARARQRRGTLWPYDQRPASAAFFLEFDPPLVYLPPRLDTNEPWAQQCELHYYNRDAIEVRQGTATREAVFEGFEDVSADDVHYADCVRLRVTTRYRLDWGPRVDTTEYIWLAPGLGEVRRIEHVSGLAWPVYFSEAYSYERVNEPTAPARLVGKRLPLPLAWSRCAVFLDRLLPHPRLGGLAVEFAPVTPGKVVAEADHPQARQACGEQHRQPEPYQAAAR